MRKMLLVLALTTVLVAGTVYAQVPGPGGPYNSSFTIQNLESQAATCVFSLYNSAGAASYTSANISIAANGSYFVYVGGLAVTSGQYSAVISCDRQVAAVANTSTSVQGSSYSGIDTAKAANILYAPGVYKNYYGYYSNVVVQNTSGAPVNITVAVYASGGTTPAATVTKNSVPANASASFDLASADFSTLGNGVFSAKISASGGALLASEVNIWNSAGQLYAFNPGSSGSDVAYAPVMMNNYYGYNTSLNVQNLGSTTQPVTVTYSNGMVKTANVAPNSFALFYTPNDVPAGNYSAKISAPGGNILTLVNESASNNRAASYEGFKSGSTKANTPIIMKHYYGYSTSIQCQNVGSGQTNVTVSYTAVGGGSAPASETINNVPANGAALFFQPNHAGMAEGYNGSAIVTSSGQPIVCVVNENQVENTALNDFLFAYDAINQ